MNILEFFNKQGVNEEDLDPVVGMHCPDLSDKSLCIYTDKERSLIAVAFNDLGVDANDLSKVQMANSTNGCGLPGILRWAAEHWVENGHLANADLNITHEKALRDIHLTVESKYFDKKYSDRKFY